MKRDERNFYSPMVEATWMIECMHQPRGTSLYHFYSAGCSPGVHTVPSCIHLFNSSLDNWWSVSYSLQYTLAFCFLTKSCVFACQKHALFFHHFLLLSFFKRVCVPQWKLHSLKWPYSVVLWLYWSFLTFRTVSSLNWIVQCLPWK